MLSGLVACASTKSPEQIATEVLDRMMVFYPSNDPVGEYLPCQGNRMTWNNCYGLYYVKDLHLISEGVFKGGIISERVIAKYLNTGKICVRLQNLTNLREVVWTCKINGSVVSIEVEIDGKRSLERERELFNQEMSKECLSLGFKENTPEMGNCILRLRELQKNNPSPQIAQPAQNKPSTADQLEGWAQILRGMQGAGQAVSPNPSTNLPNPGVVCVKSSEFTSGVYKTCVYKCVGGEATQTVSAVQICPLNARF